MVNWYSRVESIRLEHETPQDHFADESLFSGTLEGMTGPRLIFLGVLAAFAIDSAADSFELTGSKLVIQRPDSAGLPTEVNIGLKLLDVDEIDDVNQLFSVDIFFDISWHDPRLALTESVRNGQKRLVPLEEIWTPRLLISNDRGMTVQLPRIAEVDDFGNVNTKQRAFGDLSTDLQFANFPFDIQHLPIRIVSYGYAPSELQFKLNENFSSTDPVFSAEGWRFRIMSPEFDAVLVSADGGEWSRMTYLIEAERNSQYHILTMFLPVTLIVFMSWLVFWLPPDVIPSRVGISTASIFSLIAFTLSIRLSLPRVSYVTHADLFLIGCTVLVILALATVVIGSRWVKTDRLDDALRLNALARWFYVLLFGLISIGALIL